MKEKLRIFIADPAGNRTIFVLSPVERSRYSSLSEKLLSLEQLDGEQVAFIRPEMEGCIRRMEMGGMEFCGNASRSFGLYLAKEQRVSGVCQVEIQVSGINHPLWVTANTNQDTASVEMPLPLTHHRLDYKGRRLPLVVFEGILHVIAVEMPATEKSFEGIKEEVLKIYDPPALGVMFFQEEKQFMTPVVWVKDINSTFFEGSCGSGSVALACALTDPIESGHHRFTIHQPKGDLMVEIHKDQGRITGLLLDGKVELSEPMEIEL